MNPEAVEEELRGEFERISARLREGRTLTNRGTGWYLAPPYVAYQKQESELISDDIVERMEADGVISIEVPYLSAIATLVEINGPL